MRTEAELRRMLTELADTAPDSEKVALQLQLRGTAPHPGRGVGQGADRVPALAPSARRPASLVLAVCVAAALAVSLVAILLPRPGLGPAGPRLEPSYQGTVTIEPSAAGPGEWVTLTFPEAGHGTNFTLEIWIGSRWKLSYYLVAYSMSGNGSRKSWWAVGEPGGAFPQPFGMPTERVIVPPVAAAGVYRLCQFEEGEPATGSSVPPTRRACGLLTVK